jgi:hypothetical protein
MVSSGGSSREVYAVVWIADDPSENDGEPLIDGDEAGGQNPGLGRLAIIAHAFGPDGIRRVVEATIVRSSEGVSVLSWREDP